MVRQMAQTPQPGFLSSWVGSFAAFDSAHGWAVNLFLVVSLGAIGLLFVSGRARFARVGVVAGIVLCLADWVLIEDLGFLGGVGTDPNSMIPMTLVFVGGYLAMTRVPHADIPIGTEEAAEPRPSWAEGVMTSPGYSFRALAALGAIAIVLVGAVPMAAASTNPNADPIVAQAVDGTPNATDRPTPPFALVDQPRRSRVLARPAREDRRSRISRPCLCLGLSDHRPRTPPRRWPPRRDAEPRRIRRGESQPPVHGSSVPGRIRSPGVSE